MAYDANSRKRSRSVLRRVWLYCFLLALPAMIIAAILFYWHPISLVPALVLAACGFAYFALIAAVLIDSLARPLQTLSNVVLSMREGDYSFRARGAAAHDALGELASDINSLADLLQKHRVRSLEATALLARILEVVRMPLFAFDRECRLQLVNDAGLELLGIPYARGFGRTAQELGLENLLNAQDQTLHGFGPKPARWLLRKASFRQEGAPHTLLLLADVSQPLEEEEQIAWKRLIRVLGHELSNSLAPIISISGSLLARVQSLQGEEATVRDFSRGLGVVESRAEALHRFVQSYRRLAQLPPPQLKCVPLAPLLERVVLLEQRLPVQLDPGPPAAVNADSDQLEQMFINLLANAVDPSLANGAQFVRVTWEVTGPNLSVVIEDRGQGIANAENLFVPFYTTKPSGSGVGLLLAQQIARAHGGKIQLVNRDDGQGACATIRLPLSGLLNS